MQYHLENKKPIDPSMGFTKSVDKCPPYANKQMRDVWVKSVLHLSAGAYLKGPFYEVRYRMPRFGAGGQGRPDMRPL